LALTIQADVLKKLAIQANASAWIGLIVDNYDCEGIDLDLIELLIKNQSSQSIKKLACWHVWG
jgi:hypothetical protein